MAIDASSASLTGMNAAATSVRVTANNVANFRSEDFQASRLDQVDQADNGGTRATRITASEEQALPPGGSNTNLERDMVSLIRDEASYAANAAVIRTDNQMMGTLMDMKA